MNCSFKFRLVFIAVVVAVFAFHTKLPAQAVLTADGPGNTYELINSVLAPSGGDVVENPECVHPEFGRHIAEVWDADLGQYVFEFYIHTAIDNDRCINFDRQRVEIKTYDASPPELLGNYGDKVVYKWRFKVPVGFQPSPNFTHIHQIKGVGGDDGDPIFTLTPRYKSTGNQMELIHNNTTRVATLNLSLFEGNWVEATETIKIDSLHGSYSMQISNVSTGNVILNYSNNDLMTIRSTNTFIRPKWGIYRSLLEPNYLRDETLRFNNFSIFEYQKQTITFDPLPIKAIDDADFSPGAVASSGLTVSYTSSNINVATIVNNQIHIVGLGSTVITATQTGNAVYSEAPPVQQTLVVPNLNYSINATEDSYIYGNTPTTNYGTTTSLQIKENGNVIYARKSYLKFDLSGLAFANLGTAKVRLYCNSLTATTNITLASCAASWTETGITYNNAPPALTNLSNVTVSTINNYYTFDVTNYIQSCLANGISTASFVAYDNASANTTVRFNSREATANPPEMTLAGLSTTTVNISNNLNSISCFYSDKTKNLSCNWTSDENTDLSLQIFNTQGQLLKSTSKTSPSTRIKTLTFDLSDIQSGIYICRVDANYGNRSFKIRVK